MTSENPKVRLSASKLLVGGALIEQLVVLARGAPAVERLPVPLENRQKKRGKEGARGRGPV